MRLPLTLHPKPPRVLQGVLCAGHVLAFTVLWPIEMSIELRLAGGMLLLVSALCGALRLHKKRTLSLTLKADRAVVIDTGGRSIEGIVSSGGAVTPYLVVLRFATNGGTKTRLISSDMVDREDYRQLCVWLRWSGAREISAQR
jgi:hypothetical protein